MSQGWSRTEELERFKTDINLTEYAAHLGYAIDRRTSSRHSVTMIRMSDNDKVIVARGEGNRWIYFSVRDDHDNGTIIDFHQRRTSDNLGHTRKALRVFLGLGPAHRPGAKMYAPAVEAAPPRNQQALDGEYNRTEPVSMLPYLDADRAIGRKILSAARFKGRVRTDHRRNALFPHYDGQGQYSGSEIKNREFTGFSPGGEKGLWLSNQTPEDRYLVVCESAIDCLSHYGLFQDKSIEVRDHTRYVSTGGAWSPRTPTLLKQAVEEHPGRFVILAFDNDGRGWEYALDARALLGDLIYSLGKELRTRAPSRHKDWNEQLVSELSLVASLDL